MNNKIFTMIELFSGIGSQERAFRQLGIPYEIKNVCDVDKDALLSYAAMRYDIGKEVANFNFPPQEQMVAELQEKNIGYDFAHNKHTITNRTSVKKLKQYYIADKLTNNLGDISLVDELPYADIVTYSSPCQTFSLSGTLAGAKKICKTCGHEWDIDFSNPDYNYKCPCCGNVDLSSTTSGLLQEVQRLLAKSYERHTLPCVLVLENVKNLVGKKFKPQFDDWIKWLDSIGYNTYYKVLNATDYGIPQSRERVFAVSIRKDVDTGEFQFPEPVPLDTRLKDILETNVDEKYYLSEEKTAQILASICNTINGLGGINLKDQATTFDGLTDVAHMLMARDYKGFGNQSMTGVVEPFITASRGRYTSDDNSSTEQQFEPNKNGTTNTITTVSKDNYVVEPQIVQKFGDRGTSQYEAMPTLRSERVGLKVVEEFPCSTRGKQVASTIRSSICKQGFRNIAENMIHGRGYEGVIENDVMWRIRKLTPKECFRLMGFTDEDFYRAEQWSSDTALYKQAGNSIVTSCLVAIFSALLLENGYKADVWTQFAIHFNNTK